MHAGGTVGNQGKLPAVRANVHHGAAIEPGKDPRMLHPGRNAVAQQPCLVIRRFENRCKLCDLVQGLLSWSATGNISSHDSVIITFVNLSFHSVPIVVPSRKNKPFIVSISIPDADDACEGIEFGHELVVP